MEEWLSAKWVLRTIFALLFSAIRRMLAFMVLEVEKQVKKVIDKSEETGTLWWEEE
jgi:hypothetical protein